MNISNKKNIYLIIIVFLFFISLSYWAMAQEVGRVKCTFLANGTSSRRTIKEATLAATRTGFDFIFSDEVGKYLLQLSNKLIIEQAQTLGDETAMWNLVGYYKNPTPVAITPNGDFSISMMVSTRSSCTFKGQLTFFPGAKEKLFGN